LDLTGALTAIIQGLALISNGITYLIQLLFSTFGFDIPDWAIQLAGVIVLILTLLALGSKINKLILVILVILLVSTGTGLISGVLKVF
jgi:hypothetical protein